jgi:hypothetical protein
MSFGDENKYLYVVILFMSTQTLALPMSAPVVKR